MNTLASTPPLISYSQRASVGAPSLPPEGTSSRATLRWGETGVFALPATTPVPARSAAAGADAARCRGSPAVRRRPRNHPDCNCWRICRFFVRGRCHLAACRCLHAILYRRGVGAAVARAGTDEGRIRAVVPHKSRGAGGCVVFSRTRRLALRSHRELAPEKYRKTSDIRSPKPPGYLRRDEHVPRR